MSTAGTHYLHERATPLVRMAVQRQRGGAVEAFDDTLAAEEPMEIRLLWEADGETRRRSVAVTMRTPGDDFELAAGFLFGEQLIDGMEDVADVAYCRDESEVQAFNIVTVTLRPGRSLDESRLERNFYTTSSCGVCGKATLDAIHAAGCVQVPRNTDVSRAVIAALPESLRAAQPLFAETGGIHGAGLFDASGELIDVREDVGRHNAVDKLIGARLLEGQLPLDDRLLCLSGRASFELVQKALVARIPVIAAVGAPSSLAVSLAEAFGITLCGFVRPGSFNVYTGAERVRA